MRIRFIFPKWQKLLEANPELEDVLPGYYFGDFNMPGLAIESVASLTPVDIELGLTDDHLENIDFEEEVDLVALTSFTPQATRAYKIADRFRQRGVPVVIGGIHPSLRPEEAANHADYVIIGQADGPWQAFLDDFRQGRARTFYRKVEASPFRFPFPRRDLFKGKGYVLNSIIIASRGCKYACPACIIPLVDGKKIHLRPIDEVLRDIGRLEVENIFIADDVLFLMGGEYKRYARELFTRLAPLQKKLFVTVIGLNSLKNDELKLAYEAGVREMYTVFAYPPMSLSVMTKEFEERVCNSLTRIHEHGIEIFASFGLGFDYDNKGIFEKSIRFAEKIHCQIAEFFIATPFPGTPFWRKLSLEKRLLSADWELYNSANVVFRPQNMKVDELYNGYIQCWKKFFERYSFDDFQNTFTRYWRMDKSGIRRIYNRKREIKEQDTLKDS